MAYELSEQKKVGLGLLGFGIIFTFLGVMLFFDRGLLALGNIFWLTGVALLLGWRSTWNLFTSKANLKGSVSFLLGLFFLFVRWPIVGIILEIYGCLNLFGRFWPSVKAFLYEVPMLGWIIRFLFWFLINFRAVMLGVYLYNSSCLIGFPDSSEAERGLSNWLLMGLRFHHQMSEKEERD